MSTMIKGLSRALAMVVDVRETEGVTGHYTCSHPGHSLGSAFDINGA